QLEREVGVIEAGAALPGLSPLDVEAEVEGLLRAAADVGDVADALVDVARAVDEAPDVDVGALVGGALAALIEGGGVGDLGLHDLLDGVLNADHLGGADLAADGRAGGLRSAGAEADGGVGL